MSFDLFYKAGRVCWQKQGQDLGNDSVYGQVSWTLNLF